MYINAVHIKPTDEYERVYHCLGWGFGFVIGLIALGLGQIGEAGPVTCIVLYDFPFVVLFGFMMRFTIALTSHCLANANLASAWMRNAR
jgi:hypothetical protein